MQALRCEEVGRPAGMCGEEDIDTGADNVTPPLALTRADSGPEDAVMHSGFLAFARIAGSREAAQRIASL
jgi:hypothetical protein